MSQTNSEFFHGVPPSSSPDLNADEGAGLAELLQVFCIDRRSGQITYRAAGSYGYVFLQQGQPVHAICGTVEGEEAVYLMLSWPAGTYVLNEDILPHKRTISLTWEQLLFEGARRADVGALSPLSEEPVTTANPPTSTRAKDNQPKLIISHGDGPPLTVELHYEYTHLGRAEDNELSLPEPSISSRHCLFVLSGSDVMVRDLNSSNGTFVNGEQIAETVLRPGDNIQVGIIDIKFVPGVRRPKLNPTTVTSSVPAAVRRAATRSVPLGRAETTLKLPLPPERAASPDHSAFVTGTSAISYDQLAPDAPKGRKANPKLVFILIVLILVVAGGAAAYFLFLRH